MATIKSFEDILSWKKARELCDKVGKIIDEERFKKNYRLIGQIEGSSDSIMDNITEGFERSGNKDLYNFYALLKVHVVNFAHNSIDA